MYTALHVDKYKIIFKLVINLINEILLHTVFFSGISRPGIIDARARYRAAARRLRNTAIDDRKILSCRLQDFSGVYLEPKIFYAYLLPISDTPHTIKIQGKKVNLFQCYEEPLWTERKAPCILNLSRCR